MADYDLAIIGGGINGTAIARDAAGRGLSVLLVEQGDLGAGTSSATTKLIHGGLRYLEHGALHLVQEGLAERARMLKTAPHLVRPMRFILPHHKGLRPAWQLRIGLFIYDLLAGTNILPGCRKINLSKENTGAALKPGSKIGFEYSDCAVDDARLVLTNALDAAARGAKIRPRTRFEAAARQDAHWRIQLNAKGKKEEVTSKILINAAGPWIEKVNGALPKAPGAHVRLVKGSHIVVKKLFDHDKAYIFQNADGRIVFAIPYEGDFTLIGTTEIPYEGDASKASASIEEIDYLCKLANGYFTKNITAKDVIWNFSGVRALADSRSVASKDLSRDYLLELDEGGGLAPLLSVYGGKLTAARHLAEVVLDRLKDFLPVTKSWTGNAPLPGGDFDWKTLETLIEDAQARWKFLRHAHAKRLVLAYGTKLEKIFGDAKRLEDLGICFGADLTEKEVRYLMQEEWAENTEDILWRRTKLGLFLNAKEQENLASFMAKEQKA